MENERLTAEITRLKKLLENSPDGAVGGIDLLSDNNSFDAQSTDDSGGRVEKLENELRISKELIQSMFWVWVMIVLWVNASVSFQ